ncbi:MAG: SDR family oxidoreductase [Solirubrobacteraceae bacterium]|nr:SDR family oxidoreductase [Solirubrobacteraceae bacterium]
MTRTALITGASAGIGTAFAELLAAEGYDVVLVARRAERLNDLAEALVDRYGISALPLPADLAHPAAPAAICGQLAESGIEIDALINNAGLSGSTAFTETPWEKIAAELQIQVNSATELTHRLAPAMRERGWGRIVNLSSIAAFQPPAESLLYTGIKTYVLNMSQALNMELSPHGVHVTALCPGFTRSEFHDVMETREAANRLPGLLWGDADQVARAGWSAVMRGKPVCVPRTVNKFLAASMRPVPLATQYAMSARIKVL